MDNDIEYHVLPAKFMVAQYGTNRRTVHTANGETIIQVSDYMRDALYGATEVNTPTLTNSNCERKKNADFLKGMFG